MKKLDPSHRARVRIKLNKVAQGNLGDSRSVGGGVAELEIDFGPGYRVYFGQEADRIYLLLGGTKKTQDQDIKRAREFWEDHGRQK
jgi:putative addiction module killer protein